MKHITIALRLLTLAAACLLFGLANVVQAQEINGTIAGTVKDSSGAFVSGATVTITNSETKVDVRTVTTDDNGQYSAPLLAAGNYSLSVESANFKRSVQTNIQLDANQTRAVDVVLEAGNIAEVVTVEASPKR